MRHRTVREIMNGRGCQVCPPTSSVREAVHLMALHRLDNVVVADGGRVLGIVTERDVIRRVLGAGLDLDQTKLSQVMTKDPDTVGPQMTVVEVIRRMDEFGYKHLPVVEGGTVLGVVSTSDCPVDELADMAWELQDRHAIAERAW